MVAQTSCNFLTNLCFSLLSLKSHNFVVDTLIFCYDFGFSLKYNFFNNVIPKVNLDYLLKRDYYHNKRLDSAQ